MVGTAIGHSTRCAGRHSSCCAGLYSERPRGAGFRSVNPTERWCENPAKALARAGFSQHLECGIHRSESSPEGSFALIPHPVARWAKTTQFVLPLTTMYRSGAQKSNIYKRDVFVTSWRFHNRAWQPQRHDRLPETSGTLWIHRGALTNQRCSLATGCGITVPNTPAQTVSWSIPITIIKNFVWRWFWI